jgi:hypothetical protein
MEESFVMHYAHSLMAAKVREREDQENLVDVNTLLLPIASEATAQRIVRFVTEKK